MKKKEGFFRKVLDRMTGEDFEKLEAEGNAARRRGDYKTALSLYEKCKAWELAGKMAEKLGNDSLAISFYDMETSYFAGEPIFAPNPEDSARLYHKHGLLKKAFDRYYDNFNYSKAGEIAEEMKDFNLAIKAYEEALKYKNAKNKRVLRQRIKELEERRDRELSHKKGRNLTSKLSLFIITLLGFITSMFFLSSNVTGNSIANLNIIDSNEIGAVLFIFSLILGFFFIRSNKN